MDTLIKTETVDKFKNFNSLKKLLDDSRLMGEAIIEEGREFDPKKNQYFVPCEHMDYSTVEWVQIEHTNLGRRLTNYFDQLKADRKALVS